PPLALAAWQAREDAWLAELRAIDPAPFGGRPEAVAYGVMRDALEGAIATRVCRHELWNVGHTGNGAIAIITALTSLQPVGTEVARRHTLARWRAIPPYLASEEENQRTGLRLGFSAPRGNVGISVTALDGLLGTPCAGSGSPPSRRSRRRCASSHGARSGRGMSARCSSGCGPPRPSRSARGARCSTRRGAPCSGPRPRCPLGSDAFPGPTS